MKSPTRNHRPGAAASTLANRLIHAGFSGLLSSMTLIAGTTYHLDPAAGELSNPGTSDAPWPALQAVAASGRTFAAGDVLVLRSGHHGAPIVRGLNPGEVTVRAAEGARATLKSLTLRAARQWRFQGLEISPTTAASFERVQLVSLAADATAIVLEQCRLYTVEDTAAWTATDWDTRACSGISVSGPLNVIRSNVLKNVNFGISVTGVSNLVSRNVVENFSGDGLRGLGDYDTFEYNVVQNCYAVNANHDDGFQSWSVGPGGVGTGVVRGVILRGNRIVNYVDPAQPHRGTLQGIGCFDGFFEDWVIENNEILTDHWHGITLSGARNCRIVNNTVVDLNTASPGPPWIRISSHKDGTPSTNNLIRNNLATDYSVDAGAAVMDHNLESRDYATCFRDYARRDLRLRHGCPAIDAGSPDAAPDIDVEGLPRPLDGDADGQPTWDLGAHEYASPAADADTDGMSDADEALAGTSLIDGLDVLRLAAEPTTNGAVQLSWRGAVGRPYVLLASGDLPGDHWTPVSDTATRVGTGDRLTASVPMSTSAVRYFRVRVDGP